MIAAGATLAAVASGKPRLVGLVGCVGAATAQHCAAPVQTVDDHLEAYVAEMAGAADCTQLGNHSATEWLDDVDKLLTNAAVEWIQRARLHFGELKDTSADRICAKRWLAEKMKEADMRDKDACGLIPIVVEMLFIPSINEILAAKLKKSRVAGALKAMVGVHSN